MCGSTLAEIKEELESGASFSDSRETTAVAHRRRWLPWVGAAAVTALVLAVGLWVSGSREAPSPQSRTILLTSYPGQESEPSLSPDGRSLAFTRIGEAGTRDLYVKQIDGGEPIAISSDVDLVDGARPVHPPLLGDDFTPAWSPDGQPHRVR